MNLLLGVFVDIVLPLIILALALVGGVFLYRFLKNRYASGSTTSKGKVSSKPQVKVKSHYVTEPEMKFLDALHKALPRDCISFPNVGVAKLIEPKGQLVDYNIVMNKFVDICVFLRKDMSPILVIDLYDPSPAAQQLKKFDDSVTAVLKEVKIPVLHKQIQPKYDIERLKIEVLTAMNDATVAYLKDKTINSK
ncbi:MAG: DUF2726 domain-containing protein [Clostridiales bacterium]|nr:DUF2726 domain-containing protein [Clostridiales bacterium]